MRYLVIGSGHSANLTKDWTIQKHFVATVNNAWKIYPNFHIAFYAGDMPDNDRPDTHADKSKNQLFVSDLISPFRNKYTFNICRHELRIHSETSLIMTLKWMLWYSEKIQLPIESIGLIGCDMNYSPNENGHTHFYGVGKDILERKIPDPFLKETKEQIILKLLNIQDWGKRLGTEFINYSDDPDTILPFERRVFDD